MSSNDKYSVEDVNKTDKKVNSGYTYINSKYLAPNDPDHKEVKIAIIRGELYFSYSDLAAYLLIGKDKISKDPSKVKVKFNADNQISMSKWDFILKNWNNIISSTNAISKRKYRERLISEGRLHSPNYVDVLQQQRFNAIKNILNNAQNNTLPADLDEEKVIPRKKSTKNLAMDSNSNIMEINRSIPLPPQKRIALEEADSDDMDDKLPTKKKKNEEVDDNIDSYKWNFGEKRDGLKLVPILKSKLPLPKSKSEKNLPLKNDSSDEDSNSSPKSPILSSNEESNESYSTKDKEISKDAFKKAWKEIKVITDNLVVEMDKNKLYNTVNKNTINYLHEFVRDFNVNLGSTTILNTAFGLFFKNKSGHPASKKFLSIDE